MCSPRRDFLRKAALALSGVHLARLHVDASSLLTSTAQDFLYSLSEDQRRLATFEFMDAERFVYHFTPVARKGLALREMRPEQQHLAHALLSAGLSQRGYIKAATIMSLEEVLKVLENDSGERRNPGKYYFSIFGQPSDKGIWGYRVEGHHLSLHYTVRDGKVLAAPTFLGSNPREVRHGARKGLRVLSAEEDLGRDLLHALTRPQREVAVVDAVAYPDILTSNHRKAALSGQPNGLAFSNMTSAQRDKLLGIVREYTGNLAEESRQWREAQLRQAADKLHFAWAGGAEFKDPHYYRIQAPTFLIEYDCTQNEGNHIHSVWRDFTGDWGGDLL
ncbi:MAG: DUF3500 domain-containing protein, partial [Bryobacterales bacterium]|nr:DUF3500 domain-containing protein [Bryobacterales bacterium]